MNAEIIVKDALRFGSKFMVVFNDNTIDLRDDVVDALIKNSVKHVTMHETEYLNHIDWEHDVVMLLDTTTYHREDHYPKTALMVGNEHYLSETTTEDKWVWKENKFVNVGEGRKTMMPIMENLAGTPGSWENAIRISFTRLLPYVEDRTLYGVYAGPIEEHAIDKMCTLEIVEHIKKAFYDGYSRIVFDDKDEAIFWNRIYKVHSVIKRLNKIVPPGSFFFLTSALNATEIYKQWCKRLGEDELLIMIPCARFESVAKDMMMDRGILEHYDDLNTPISTDKRPKKFLCYNRMPRLHRVKMITELHKRGVTSSGLISFHDEQGALSESRWRTFNHLHYKDTHWTETFRYFYSNIFPFLNKYKLNKTEERWNPVDVQRDDLQHFADTYFSVVNETLFYKDTYRYKELCDISPTDSVFLSEKIFKPLACKHPFVVIGVDKTLENLRKYGYKTFDGWIDEFYDLEPDDDKRMEMCVNEIERLAKLPDDQWQQMIEEMTPTLQHNFDTLCRNKDLIVAPLNFLEIFRNTNPY